MWVPDYISSRGYTDLISACDFVSDLNTISVIIIIIVIIMQRCGGTVQVNLIINEERTERPLTRWPYYIGHIFPSIGAAVPFDDLTKC